MRNAFFFARRALSSQGSSSELKRHLHRFYQLVHPDRHARNPKLRDVNLKSFQILQAALHRHFHSDGIASHEPDPVTGRTTLVFFAHKNATDPEPCQVRAELEPGRRSLSEALLKLYAQLELEPPPAHILTPPRPPAPEERKFSSLSDLAKVARRLSAARAMARQEAAAQAATKSAEYVGDAKVLVLALQRAFGITISVDDSVPRDKRLPIFLHRVRDALKDAATQLNAPPTAPPLRGVRIILNSGFDAQCFLDEPTVLLGTCASRDQWDSVLQDLNLVDACQRMRDSAAMIRDYETRAAEKIGCSLIFHHFESRRVDDVPRYLELLKNLAEGNDSGSRPGMGVALMIVDGNDVEEDITNGILSVGIDLSVQNVREVLEERGPRIGGEYLKAAELKEERDKAKRAVVRALRIGSLTRDEMVTDSQWVHCLKQLRKHTFELKGLFDGADVSIVNGNAGIGKDGLVYLPWNFSTTMRP